MRRLLDMTNEEVFTSLLGRDDIDVSDQPEGLAGRMMLHRSVKCAETIRVTDYQGGCSRMENVDMGLPSELEGALHVAIEVAAFAVNGDADGNVPTHENGF